MSNISDHKPVIIEVQIGFIFQNIVERPDLLVPDLERSMGNIFTIPNIASVPNDPAYNEVVVAQMISKDGLIVCQISKTRIDLFVKGSGIQSYADIKMKIHETKDKFLSFVFSKYKASRIAYITRNFIVETDNAGAISKLIDNSFKELMPGTPAFSTVHYTSTFEMDEMTINNYSLIGTGITNIVTLGNDLVGVLISRDYNTVQDKDYSTKINKNFFDRLILHAESNFKLNEIISMLW